MPPAAMVQDFYYRYQPLEGTDHIRLLKCTPRANLQSGRGVLRRWAFSLVHVSLDNAPPFETISYAWGNTARFYKLPMEGTEDIAVTKSAFEALPYLIQNSETGLLWMDQICINQDDLDERGHQVALMGKVFSNSRRTIIWLGLEDRHPKQASRLLEKIRAVSPELRYDKEILRKVDSLLQESRGLSNCKAALESTLHRPWFSRAWVIQELILSSSFITLVGQIKVEWNPLTQAVLAQ